MKVLIIDNYDSFTYNLYQAVGEILESQYKLFTVDVFRNDKITVSEISKRAYDRIILSPGPGDPSDKSYFGVCVDVLLDIGKKIPVFGVCLGMQGMAHYFGGKVVKATSPMHGKTSEISHDGKGIFKGLPQRIHAMRYHSLIADEKSLPSHLIICAYTTTNGVREIMGLRHHKYPIEGIQFHPESFATEGGKIMLANFLFRKGMSS